MNKMKTERTKEVVLETIKDKILGDLKSIKDGDHIDEIHSLYFLLFGYTKIIHTNIGKTRIIGLKNNIENKDIEKMYFVKYEDNNNLTEMAESDIIGDDTYCFLRYSNTGKITLYPQQFENLIDTITNDFDEIKTYEEMMSKQANIPHYVLSKSIH